MSGKGKKEKKVVTPVVLDGASRTVDLLPNSGSSCFKVRTSIMMRTSGFFSAILDDVPDIDQITVPCNAFDLHAIVEWMECVGDNKTDDAAWYANFTKIHNLTPERLVSLMSASNHLLCERLTIKLGAMLAMFLPSDPISTFTKNLSFTGVPIPPKFFGWLPGDIEKYKHDVATAEPPSEMEEEDSDLVPTIAETEDEDRMVPWDPDEDPVVQEWVKYGSSPAKRKLLLDAEASTTSKKQRQ